MDEFFGAPEGDAVAPDSLPPATEDGGFTLLGEAEEAPTDDVAPYVGDVQEEAGEDMGMGFAAAPEEDMGMGFAAAPEDMGMGFAAAAPSPSNPDVMDDDDGDFMGFAAAPADDIDNSAPIIMGAPPALDDVEDAPIVLGGPPSAPEIEDVDDEEEEVKTEEPSAMKKFNAEWQETLANRKQEEDDSKAAMIEAARVATEEFQTKASMKRDAKMAKNREDEQAKLEDIEADLENDNNWQRVSKMVDLTQDAEGGEDTKRMRDVFILLKNEQGLAAKVGA